MSPDSCRRLRAGLVPSSDREGRLQVAVALAGQEDQDVAVALRAQLVHRQIAVSTSMSSPCVASVASSSSGSPGYVRAGLGDVSE